MNDRKKPKISKINDRSLYGKTPLESWVGTVVSYDAQKEQIEGGWGWRYKVRIMGDNTQSDTITDDKLDYAYCLLPTTAGSGGAYKLRSVRVSQGDFVYGVKGGGGPLMILAVYPRTSKQVSGDGHFKNLSGFTGSLKNTGILDGEFNEQIGPTTPGASGLSPKEWTKATAKNPSEKVKEIVPQVKKQENGEFEEVSVELTEKNDVKKNAGKVVDPLKWEPGTPLNTATMEALKESFENGSIPPQKWEAALKQASEQGLDGYEEYVIKDEIKEVKKVEVKEEIKEEKEEVKIESKTIQILSKAYPYVDTSEIKTYADYIAEGVEIREIGQNDFVFKYPNGKEVISRRLGSSNAPTVESRFDSLAFTLQKDKQDDLIEKQKRDEAQRLRNIEFAKKFPNLYNPDGTRKK